MSQVKTKPVIEGADKVESAKPTTGVLKIKLGACLNMPTKRMREDFDCILEMTNRVKCAMVRGWLFWHESQIRAGTPYVPAPLMGRDGLPRPGFYRRGRLIMPVVNAPMPAKVAPLVRKLSDEVTFPTYLYQAGVGAEPRLSTNIVTACSQRVAAKLKADMPYDHEGVSQYFWQAVLSNEVSPPSYRGRSFPIATSNLTINYSGFNTDDVPEESSCWAQFGLWSTKAGRAVRDVRVRLEMRQMTRGNRGLLRRCIQGYRNRGKDTANGYTICDSEIVRGDDGAWYLHLVYQQPAKDLGLNKANVAVLVPSVAKRVSPHDPNAQIGTAIVIGAGFLATDENGESWGLAPRRPDQPSPWRLGDLRLLMAQRRRLMGRYLAMTGRRSVPNNARLGHGQQRFYRDAREARRSYSNVQRGFLKQLVAEVVRYCVLNNYGTLMYREPTLPARQRTWWALNEFDFNWSEFGTRLGNKCKQHGIVLVVKRASAREFAA